MIRLNNVKKYYGSAKHTIHAADDVSIFVDTNEFAVITGPSGSGKSTLLNLIGGMTLPDHGEIIINGQDILAMNDLQLSKFRANTIGFIFQSQSMIPTLNALENVQLPLLFSQKMHNSASATTLLQEVGLKDRLHSYAHELSAGQQRRVGIARALVNQPDLLLLDEPTGDLDPETETLIMEMIKKANNKGTTILLTTHNPALRIYADRKFVITNGSVHEDEV